MHPIVSEHLDEMIALCEKRRVRRLELFGSAAVGDFDAERSDLDFLVIFEEMSPGDHAHAYFGLLADLRNLFNRRVDLVETLAIENPFFRESIRLTRMVLYAA